jgi:hypothetical protein
VPAQVELYPPSLAFWEIVQVDFALSEDEDLDRWLVSVVSHRWTGMGYEFWGGVIVGDVLYVGGLVRWNLSGILGLERV